MYRKRHHWVYLHGQFPIYISDGISRLASPEDLQMVALCARILIYEQASSPDSNPPNPVSSSHTALGRKDESILPIRIASAVTSSSPARCDSVRDSTADDKAAEHVFPGTTSVSKHPGLRGRSEIESLREPNKKGREHPRCKRSRKTLKGLASYGPSETSDNRTSTASPIQRRQFTLADYFNTSDTLHLHGGSLHQVSTQNVLEQPVHSSRTEGRNLPPVSQHIEQEAGMQRVHQGTVSSAQEGHTTPEEGYLSKAAGINIRDQRRGERPFFDRMIREVDGKVVHGKEVWIAGTDGLYPRPRGARPPNEHPTRFPLWNPRVDGKPRQQAMFDYADRLSPAGAFYVAADVWTKKTGKDWGLGKVFGAFQSVNAFILQFLEIAPHRCFYEIIRENRPCKAYFDLEAAPGAMNKEEGASMCEAVTRAWAARIRTRWPIAEQECPRCLVPMILNGSRATDHGWKVSYHVIYPWLTFSRNNTTLREEVTLLSSDPRFHYNGPNGIQRFIDSTVYTRNRQFRLPMCFKLSDRSRTGLGLPGPPLLSTFGRACISKIEVDSWLVPEESLPAVKSIGHVISIANQQGSVVNDTRMLDKEQLTPLINYLHQLLHRQGHPPGQLTPQGKKFGKETFRWSVSPGRRPCMVAQQWRPSDPTHDSNAALILLDKKGAVYIKCLHPECVKWRYLDYIDTVPLNIFTSRVDIQKLPDNSEIRARKRGRDNSGSIHTAQPRHKTSEAISVDRNEPPTADPGGEVPPPPLKTQPRQATPQGSTLSWIQSCKRVHEENQEDDDGSLKAWHIPALPFGGRMGGMDSETNSAGRKITIASDIVMPDRADSTAESDEVVTTPESIWLQSLPFTQPIPPALIQAVAKELASANSEFAQTCGDLPPGWKEVTGKDSELHSSPIPTSQGDSITSETVQWSIQPDSKWFQSPIAQRPSVGHSLIRLARERSTDSWQMEQQSTYSTGATPDLWASPFRIGYLNVGRRRFRLSLEGIAAIVTRHRPDILFLGDMGATRAHIGRLRQRLEAELDDEWFLWTDINASPGYPIGMGAVIHCSLAQYISKIELPCPPDLDKEIWTGAVAGRLMQLEVTRPELPKPWRFIGIYQHVAKRAPRNIAATGMVRRTLDCILEQTASENRRILLLGDVNSAPFGGRWGYSSKNHALLQADRIMMDWVISSGLTEVSHEPLQATWKPNLEQKSAVLDRAFLFTPDAQLAGLQIHWAESSMLFDHAAIMINLPHSVAGMGFAGACPPIAQRSEHQTKINVSKWMQRQCRDEWARLLQNCLEAEDEDAPAQDPFQALKTAEVLAESIARRLAPKYSTRPGESKRSFRFPGHRRLCREIDILQHARQLVFKVVRQSSEIMHCPHRISRWELAVRRHAGRSWASGFGGPPQLVRNTEWYFTPAAQHELIDWMEQAKIAVDARWALIREDFTKARRYNLQNLRLKLMKKGFLDARTLRTALGIRQPRRRMFAISGEVATGVRLGTAGQTARVLDFLEELPAAGEAVQLLDTSKGLQVWFRGPQPLGNFLAAWCANGHNQNFDIVLLYPQCTYVAITPDDMLAVQELHLASEGMDTASMCPSCRGKDIQPISTSAEQQRFGNPTRAVRFFCARCRIVIDQVELPPLAECPIPHDVWTSLRRIPPGTAPLLARPVDYDTLEAIVRRLKDGKAPGCDGFLREFYKYGPPALIALLQAAINAFISGRDPTVNPEEWLGALIALLPKSLAALLMSEFRPAGKPCAKFVIFSKVVDGNFRRSIEEYKTVDEAQEGFRPNRNTKRQITKQQCLLERARRRQTISVILYLDIKNAFNAINHRAMLAVLRACGYPEQDVELFRRMYAGTFLMVANQFGLSAACFLLRGVLQGAPTSPNVFNVAFNPVHVLVRACKRGCAPLEDAEPMGSSGFADDTTLHSDGPDAVPAMQVIVQAATPFLDWLGLLLNMRKSFIAAIDYATGRAVATDSITFNGNPFTALSPDTAHKALGVLMTLTGNYQAHKDYVMAKMEKRCIALAAADSIPRGELRELAVTCGIVSIFRATAGVVPWTGAELDRVSQLWIRAFKQAWECPTSMDSSVIILEKADSGRACPSARAVWTEDTLTVLDQCIQLPGTISALVLNHWRAACSSRGCVALNQLQKVIRIDGAAESIVELLALRLDEQGTEFSTPWPPEPGSLVLEALWPQVQEAWRAKQGWKGCTELSRAVQEQWEQAKFSLKMCRMLGKVGILYLTQLTTTTGRGVRWEELRAKQCEITKAEYLRLLSYLQHGEERLITSDGEGGSRVEGQHQTPELASQYHPVSYPLVSAPSQLPSCIKGRVRLKTSYERFVLEQYPGEPFSDTELSKLSDTQLMDQMCKARAVFQYTMDGESYFAVECLAPLSRVWNTPRGQELIVAQVLQHRDQAHQVGVIGMALVRDSLKDNGVDSLAEACRRPSWLVSREEFNVWFPSTRWERAKEEQSTQLSWQLLPTGVDGQQQLAGLSQGIIRRREPTIRITKSLIPSYIWHTDPPLPSKIVVDLSNHTPKQLPAPVGWEILQRNARVLITDTQQRTFGLDAAQYGMLLALNSDRRGGKAVGDLLTPTETFLLSLKLVCRAQRRADSEYVVPWNRHFITCVQQVTDTHLLLGVSAVTYNPHFEFFASPHSQSEGLGAVRAWPDVRALLLLDSIEPDLRQEWLHKAAEHTKRVLILRSHKPSMAASEDLRTLAKLKARCIAIIPAGYMLLHIPGFWQNAEWDCRASEHAAQIWLFGDSEPESIHASRIDLSLEALGDWSNRRYDFHWCHDSDRVPPTLCLYRQFQQDALQYTFPGLVGGTDGSACMRTDRMGAGFALGTERKPLLQFSAPVGGPLSSMRAEAASLLQFLRRVRAIFPDQHTLLIFIDCLVLLDILMKWGKSEFQPQPRDIVHFDILVPLLIELRLWPGTVLLMKIKSHAGCLLNERADELAELGVKSEDEQISPGPSKHGSVWLRIRESWRHRVRSEKLHHIIPRDTAPNKSILKLVSAVNFLRAMTKRNTKYVRHLLHREEGTVLSRVVSRNDDAVLRVWYKAMTGIYPVQVYLHRIGAVKSPHCPHCSNNELETLTHFACVCPTFREARTAAHNQLRAVLAASLKNFLSEDWSVFEETPLASTGLKLQQVPDDEVRLALDATESITPEAGNVRLDRWQPDFILISWKRKRIAVLELTRPSDMLTVQLDEAYRRKKRKYCPIKAALHYYIREGWTIEILPWVIGIRGLADTVHLQTALSFLDIPQQKWAAIIEDSVLASVRALAYMHRIRYSGSNRKPAMDKVDQQMPNARTGRKRRRPTTESIGELRLRWKKLKGNSKWRARGRTGGDATSSTLSSHIKKARERKGEG